MVVALDALIAEATREDQDTVRELRAAIAEQAEQVRVLKADMAETIRRANNLMDGLRGGTIS